MVSAFRAFRSTVKPAFEEYRSPLFSIDVLLTWATTSFAAIPVRTERRRVGGSNYRFRSLARHAVLAYVLGRFLFSGTTVAGFPFLASIIAIFSGAQLFALGILGEYLGRMHMRTMDRPAYIVRTATPQQ